MKAAVLEDFGVPLSVVDVPDPHPGVGEVVVDVLAAGVLPYAAEVFSGARRYPLETPVIPGVGGIGRVREVGPDLTRLRPGALVWCDPTVRSRDDAHTPDITLQGWSSRGEGGLRLSRHYHDGAYAERALIPAECAVPLGVDALSDEDAARWAGISVPLVPYGGLRAVGLRAGETVLVSGATGNFGSAAVAVAFAMGATTVIGPGRNRRVLDDLAARFGPRFVPVPLTGRGDQEALRAHGPVDVVIDLLPPSAGADVVRTAVMAVREQGRVVLMGGVGMLGGDDLALPYPWLMRNGITLRGQWMCPREAVQPLLNLVRAGSLDLTGDSVTTFSLAQVNEAVEHAAAHSGPFQRTVVLPG
ncbi:zinc-binding dehydrogenase [Actinokineospora bangkokensis]|uniref:Alcohol dehydrogenase n=1 Tax=Actinokineospora bangkokensis TaxID=1193682 RepID=A0A1Q9LKF5_9PSEU|nr:zinc-binding alcohol dehydrogenase family protein [Actinokineospora bangkokensis]OLR92500.1 alcohol dehydrogenase [Actinokineospora bangkokensis]